MAKVDALLSKDEFIGKVAEVSGETKASASNAVDAIPKVVIGELLAHLPKKPGEISGAVPVPGLGAFAVKRQPAVTRKNNLNGGGEYTIPEHNVPMFKISNSVKTALNADVLGKIKKDSADKKDAAKKGKTA